MKKIVFLLSLFIVSNISYSQVSGSTQPGKLIFNKEVKNQEAEITAPQIILLEPNISTNNTVDNDADKLRIRGYVQDNYGLKEVSINGILVKLFSDNHFDTKIALTGGDNAVTVRALNIKEKSTEISFLVNSKTDKEGPTVIITEPVVSRGIKIIRKSEVTTVRGFATDISGILDVTVNDQKPVLAKNGEFSIDLYLQLGDNKVVVKAIDNKLNTTIDTFTVTRKLEDIITGGRYVALVIGINSYTGYWPSLKNAVNDANGIAEVLKKDYMFNDVITLLDKDATRKNIIHHFENLTSNLTKDDNLLIFYAGHGQYNKALNKGYWVPVDATSNSVADYISNSDVKTFLGGIPSKHTLLITDACFSGDIFRGAPAESIPFDPNNMEKYYKEVYRKQSRLALTSGGIEEVMDSGKDHHSIFTYYLIKSLQENKQKYLDSQQLFSDFRIAVSNNSDQTPMLQVVRDTDDEGGQFVFIRNDK
jgi:Caspase domain/Glucodextranase, domain B